MPTLVLLGDSILDNRPYVTPKLDTAEHLHHLLSPEWSVSLLARDGAFMADVQLQLNDLPSHTDCAVLSVGGNEAIDHIGLLRKPARSVSEVLAELESTASSFGQYYDKLVGNIVLSVRRLALCTIYEPPLFDPISARLARVPLSLLNDQIIRCAGRRGLEVLDLRTVCTRLDDFVMEIEPSPAGARKIAETIARVVQGRSVIPPARLFAA